MANKEPDLPFRWNILGGDRTGSLPEGIDHDPAHVDELAECATEGPGTRRIASLPQAGPGAPMRGTVRCPQVSPSVTGKS